MKHKQLGIGFIFLLAIVGVVGLTVVLARNYLHTSSVTTEATNCDEAGTEHVVTIQANIATPKQLAIKQCDRLTITNADSVSRLIAFGQHDEHVAYDGIEEKLLAKGESLTVDAVMMGTFVFHDHYDEAAGGEFTVN